MEQTVNDRPEILTAEYKQYKYDCRKSRRNNLYDEKYEFPVFSVMDIVKPYSGTLQCGLYFVKTDNIFPFRGNGWYLQALVEYGIKQNIITNLNITAELIASKRLPVDYFRKHVDILLKAFEVEPDIQKLSVNLLVGLFGRTKASISKTKFTLDPYTASQWWAEKEPKSNVFIRNNSINEGNDTLYQGIFEQKAEMEGTKYPLYKQVLELEIIELHKLETALKSKRAIVVDRNTDAIRYLSKNEIELNGYWDDDKKVKKYQKEEPKPLRIQMKPRLQRTTDLDMSVFDLQWNTQYDYDGSVNDVAVRIAESKSSIHIDGRAGVGKTTLLNAIRNELETRGLKWRAFSPTNKGARLIGGATIHSIYFKYKSKKANLFRILETTDCIFIDEVSIKENI